MNNLPIEDHTSKVPGKKRQVNKRKETEPSEDQEEGNSYEEKWYYPYLTVTIDNQDNIDLPQKSQTEKRSQLRSIAR